MGYTIPPLRETSVLARAGTSSVGQPSGHRCGGRQVVLRPAGSSSNICLSGLSVGARAVPPFEKPSLRETNRKALALLAAHSLAKLWDFSSSSSHWGAPAEPSVGVPVNSDGEFLYSTAVFGSTYCYGLASDKKRSWPLRPNAGALYLHAASTLIARAAVRRPFFPVHATSREKTPAEKKRCVGAQFKAQQPVTARGGRVLPSPRVVLPRNVAYRAATSVPCTGPVDTSPLVSPASPKDAILFCDCLVGKTVFRKQARTGTFVWINSLKSLQGIALTNHGPGVMTGTRAY